MANASVPPLQMHQVELFADYPPALLQFAAACCIIYIVIGIPGNAITIVALCRYRKVRSVQQGHQLERGDRKGKDRRPAGLVGVSWDWHYA